MCLLALLLQLLLLLLVMSQKMSITTPVPPDRTLAYMQPYAAAVADIGKQAGVPVVDLFNRLQAVPGWQTQLLKDGLHFTPAGSMAVWQELREVLEAQLPQVRWVCVVVCQSARKGRSRPRTDNKHSVSVCLSALHSHTVPTSCRLSSPCGTRQMLRATGTKRGPPRSLTWGVGCRVAMNMYVGWQCVPLCVVICWYVDCSWAVIERICVPECRGQEVSAHFTSARLSPQFEMSDLQHCAFGGSQFTS